MMKLKVSLFLALSCTHFDFIASDQGSRQNSKELLAPDTVVSPENSSFQTQSTPYSETRYSLWTAAGKTNTSYLVERDEDGSLAATLQEDPTRAKTLYYRSMRERSGKDLLDERNQERLKTIIEIGKKYSKNLQSVEVKTAQPKLELDQDIATTFRPQQEQALLTLLSQQKNELAKLRLERKTAEQLAETIYNQGVETMKSRAAIMSHNYSYLKKQSKHTENLIGDANKKEPYKTIQSFSALLDSIPAESKKDNAENA